MSQKLLLLMLSFFLLAGTSTYESKACGSNPGKPIKNSCLPKAKMKTKTSVQQAMLFDLSPITHSFFLN